MNTKLPTQINTNKPILPIVIAGCPVPVTLIPYLEKKGLKFKRNSDRLLLTNLTYIDLTIATELDILAIIFATFEHDNDEKIENLSRITLKPVA